MSMEDDDNSVSSSASSVHDAITSEIDRRKERLRRMRDKRRFHYENKKVDPAKDDEDDAYSSLRRTNSNSIMTVRTLEESLNGGALAEMRKLRRKVYCKFKNGASYDEGEPHIDDDGTRVSLGSNDSDKTASTLTDYSLGFLDVIIREYELVPGCNPSISKGPPVELGWGHTEDVTHSLDAYERARFGRRRLQSQMRMPTDIRENLLLLHGSNLKEIKSATKEALQTKKQRASTAHIIFHKGELHDEQMEALKNALTKPFRRRKKRQEERELRELEAALQT